MSLLIWFRIKKRSKTDNVPIPREYKTVLTKYKNAVKHCEQHLIFSWLSDWGSNVLNASATIPGFIFINAEWAANIVLHDNNDTTNAFLITIGHELSHKDGDIPSLSYHGTTKRFICWINEVHADFCGAQKMCNSQRISLVNSCEYKHCYKVKQIHKDDDAPSHPSWSRRKKYAECYDFDETLIRKIAIDTKCTDKTIIQQAILHFKPIKLI